MNEILIIGNGFDIYHGLPTRYSDFIFLAEHWEDFYNETLSARPLVLNCKRKMNKI